MLKIAVNARRISRPGKPHNLLGGAVQVLCRNYTRIRHNLRRPRTGRRSPILGVRAEELLNQRLSVIMEAQSRRTPFLTHRIQEKMRNAGRR